MAEVVLRNVTKRFGDTTALDNVSMTVPDGAFVVLLGPTGAGKTTTLRMVSGLDAPDLGDVHFDGQPMAQATPSQRNVAMVFQQYSLYPHLTVRDNLAFPLRSPLLRTPADEIARKVGEVAEVLQISHKLDNKATALSGGEMQRVSIGRALVRNPSVYLMDEPLSSLDAKLRADLRIELKSIQANRGATLLYVTHDQIEAMTMADKIVVLEGGNVSQVGSPLDLYDNPTNRFVATFIGSPSMNLLPAVAREGATLELTNGQSVVARGNVAANRSVDYGIRPEHLSIGQEGEGFCAEIVVVEPTGSETHVICTLNGTEVVAVLRERVSYQPGDKIWLVPDPDKSHLFCRDSGQVLH